MTAAQGVKDYIGPLNLGIDTWVNCNGIGLKKYYLETFVILRL